MGSPNETLPPNFLNKRYKDIAQCAQCREELVKPKVVTCGHNMCETCEKKLIVRPPGPSSRPGITCPSCNKLSSLDGSGLPVNYTLRDLMSYCKEQLMKQFAEVDANYTCSSCHAKLTPAGMFMCKTCSNSLLCGKCMVKIHNGHDLLHFDDVLEERKHKSWKLYEDIVDCPICCEKLDKPKVLPCGHCFCEACEKRMRRRYVNNRITCTICKTVSELPEDQPGVPVNYMLCDLMSYWTGQLEKTGQLMKNCVKVDGNYTCSSCDAKFTQTGMFMCNTCDHNVLCGKCLVKIHNGHDVLHFGDVLEDRKQKVRQWKIDLDGRYRALLDSGQLAAKQTSDKVEQLVKLLRQTILQKTHQLTNETQQFKDKFDELKVEMENFVDELVDMSEVMQAEEDKLVTVQDRNKQLLEQNGRIFQMIEDFSKKIITAIDTGVVQAVQLDSLREAGDKLASNTDRQNTTTSQLCPQFDSALGEISRDVRRGASAQAQVSPPLGGFGERPSTSHVRDRSPLQQKASTNEQKQIYIIGGGVTAKGYFSDSVLKYNLVIGCQFTNMKLKTPRHFHCAAYCHPTSQMVVIGGFTDQATISGEICSLTDDAPLFAVILMKQKRLHANCLCIGTNLFVIGGKGTSKCECYDMREGTWTDLEPLPYIVDGASCVLYQHGDQKTILLIGRCGNNTPTKMMTVLQYEPDQDTWTEWPDLPTALYRCAVVNWRGTVVVLGGAGVNDRGYEATKYCYLLDSEGKWVSLPPMKTARSSHQAVVFDGKIVVLGGMDERRKTIKSVEVFDGVQWTDAPELDDAMQGFTAIVI